MKKLLNILFEKGFVVPSSCALILIVRCLYTSAGKYMWMDELLTYFPSSFASFPDMMSFVTDKINAGNYLYFIVIWAWAKVFSATALSLRLFSSFCFCVSVFFSWVSLKKVYGVWSSSCAVIIVFLNSDLILQQNVEARFYGLFFALLTILLFITVTNLNESKPCGKMLLCVFLVNGFLPLTHLFGFVYSLLFLAAIIFVDIKTKNFRVIYYVTTLSGWLLFIPFIPAFKKAMELSKPHFWINRPSIRDLTSFYLSESAIYFSLFVVGFVLIITTSNHISTKVKQDNNQGLILLIALFSLIVPLVIWLYSQVFQSLFLPRYLILFELGLLIVTAAGFSRLLQGYLLPPYASVLIKAFFVIFFISAINTKPSFSKIQIGATDYFPAGVPIVSDKPHNYLPRAFYNPLYRQYYFILDWEVAVDESNSLNASQDFQVMEALKRHLPQQNIVYSEDFLRRFPVFIVLPGRLWLEYRIRDNPNYSIQILKDGAYLVKKKS